MENIPRVDSKIDSNSIWSIRDTHSKKTKKFESCNNVKDNIKERKSRSWLILFKVKLSKKLLGLPLIVKEN